MESLALVANKELMEDSFPLLPCLSRGNSQNEHQTAFAEEKGEKLTGSDMDEPAQNTEDILAPESDSAYNSALRDLRFNSFAFSGDFVTPPGLNTSRVSKELKSLARDLPCESSASIYLRMHSDSLCYFRALISGSSDTPYAYGLFLFDIHLPEEYPVSPPLMHILTTGNGRLRFNPNLYSDGYMCLSVLNTWSSSPEEMWNPALSSLFQVLVSIQSLIMDENVIQKEPGYDEYSTDSTENVLYRDIVRYGNMKWGMAETIRNPPEGFEDVVMKHFAMVREEVEKVTLKWVEETADDNPEDSEGLVSSHNSDTIEEFHSNGRKACMQAARTELLEVFRQLE